MFLALGIATLLALISTPRLLAGLALVAIVVGCVTIVRIFGVPVDGAADETMFKLVPELALVAASVIGLLIERGRRRHLATVPAAA